MKGIMMWKRKGGWKRWHYDLQIKTAGWIITGIMIRKSNGGWKR